MCSFFKGDANAARALGRLPFPRVVDQDAAHELRGNREELGAIPTSSHVFVP